MKTVYFDLDGIIADSTERFKRAEKPGGKPDWKAALNPAHVRLDVPIEGALEAVEVANRRNFRIVYLTGRPELMREATLNWLAQYGFYLSCSLLMRADGDYRPAGLVKADQMTLDMIAHADTDIVVIVDDMPENARDILNNAELDGARMYLAFSIPEFMQLLSEKF